MGAVAFLWTLFSAAFFLVDPAHHPEWLAMIIVPAAMLAGSAADWLHHAEIWRFVRYPLALAAIATLYAQVQVNFVRYGPDSSEAGWARHMVLFWNEPTTTLQAEQECSHAERAVTDRATVYFDSGDAVLQWYLRRLDNADQVSAAELIVSPVAVAKHVEAAMISDFTLEEQWDPDLRALNAQTALRYFLTQRAWTPVSGRDARIELRAPAPAPAPSSMPSPAPSPTQSVAPSAEPTPSASASAAATESATAAPTPAETASPTPAP